MYTQEIQSLITQDHLDRIVKKLKLSQNNAMTLASELKRVNILAPDDKVTTYKHRQEQYMGYFMLSEDATYAYCQDVPALMKEMGICNYNPTSWRLFIDASTRSLKVVLLFEDNSIKPVPLMYAIGMKESHDTMKLILSRINYDKHNWRVNCDFKLLSLLAEMQSGYTKYMCGFCKWDSRAKCNQLGIVKNFIKRLKVVILPYFNFTHFTLNGVLNGPDIRKLFKDEHFKEILDKSALNAWDSIRAVIENVLCKNRFPNYRDYIENMMKCFDEFEEKMSLKIHMLHAHFDFYERQMSTETDETGERFHLTIMVFEDRFAGKRIDSMLADFCWSIANEK
ncbi:hypothetical protein CVS40_11714 [Lucilia cuprina]|nr:hypothetical protein CVS40_11714 [Lucilia cuprina]